MRVNRGFLRAIFLALAAGLIAFGTLGLYGNISQESIKHSIPENVISTSYAAPGLDDVSELCSEYRVGLSKPRYIYISATKSAGCIHSVGVDQNNLIATPVNVNLAGWYVSSVKPGEPGISVLIGYDNFADKSGIFTDFDSLAEGDEIMVQIGDKSKLYFNVVDAKTYKGSFYIEHILDPLNTSPRQLTLVSINAGTSPSSYTLVRASLAQ